MSWMLVVISGLVAVFAAVGTWQTLKEKHVLGFIFNFGTLVVFGGFSIATLITSGYPPAV